MAKLFNAPDSEKGLLILHGGSAGVESSFVQKMYKKGVDNGLVVLAYDFPYKLRGGKQPSEGFAEEIPTVLAAVERVHTEGIKDMHVVAKSVGSAILAEVIRQNPDIQIDRVTIAGLPLGLTKLEPLAGKHLHIVHGEFDRFGNVDEVKAELAKAGIAADVSEIKGATHSFRDPETDTQPIYEDEAIKVIEL